MQLTVFAGPSMPAEDRVPIPGVTYARSARRGDVAQAAVNSRSVLLLDGAFDDDLAPSPKEILHACRAAKFIGAASMGALRAVECMPFGAHACGTVARWYARGAIDGDDEVAVLVERESERALTVPLVNVRYLLGLARRFGVLDRTECDAALRRAREIFYADRTWEDVLEAAARSKRTQLARLTEFADLKRRDARRALRCSLRLSAGGGDRVA